MVKISPSLFTIEKKDLANAVKSTPNADFFHIDVTDGVFVKDKSGGASLFYDDNIIKLVTKNTKIPLDVHLMVDNPLKDIERYAQYKPKFISFHFEATKSPEEVIKEIRKYGVKPVIALNPFTPISKIEKLLSKVEMVLVMSVVPGKGGQGYIAGVTKKIKKLRSIIDERGLDTLIEVDGGIKLENVYIPLNAGADTIVSGTGVYNHEKYNPYEVIEKMKDVIIMASDQGGYFLKETLKKYLEGKKIAYKDIGCYGVESVDYPDYAKKLVKRVLSKEYKRGILLCGTGIGMSICANRYKGIRATLCFDEYAAEMSRKHGDSNVLCLGGRTTSFSMAKKIFDIWYSTPFEGGRHKRRLDKIDRC